MVSIAVLVCNEQESLPILYTRLSAVAPALDDDYEVIGVNDG